MKVGILLLLIALRVLSKACYGADMIVRTEGRCKKRWHTQKLREQTVAYVVIVTATPIIFLIIQEFQS